jgi:hypothetical protein
MVAFVDDLGQGLYRIFRRAEILRDLSISRLLDSARLEGEPDALQGESEKQRGARSELEAELIKVLPLCFPTPSRVGRVRDKTFTCLVESIFII